PRRRDARVVAGGLPLLQPLLGRGETVARGRPLLAKLVSIGIRRPAPLRWLGRSRPARRRRPPPRARGPLAEHAFHVALTRHEAFEARAPRALDELLPRLAVLDELMPK